LPGATSCPRSCSSIHSDSPLVAPASPADAIWLARNLAELIDSIETEERTGSELGKLDDAKDHALWWQLTAEFLQIASAFWPERLNELGKSSPARHRNAILRAEALRIATMQASGPIIIAGSTGSVPATADLIAAVAKARRGRHRPARARCRTMPDGALADGGARRMADAASRSHSQYGLAQLLKRLELTREDVARSPKRPDLRLRAQRRSRMRFARRGDQRLGRWKAIR
jgi:ATP-dependent helicase/nuclease subunit B